ncbi:thiamine-phosphate pyrophosphorylase [Roseivirga pacifica]|uniref:Thiamine-phosphate diphosphorylase n=1 Tax=Roseivirga pacifica TaxID=1267423 RepID=A0A1I0QQ96_9BACT|nr:thiamine phosphate synthase [Roseivirga pacifica]RKQ42690.1 thiamine-phosphate pyrophosphorylase [Roseivirga pacifica]SEW29670.1 thiamine-phosphate diphosphorylase [Roseivirga pacifica]
MKKSPIKAGVYLVIDPSMELNVLLEKLESALKAGLSAVQIWDNFKRSDIAEIISAIVKLCQQHQTPVLINNQWEFLNDYGLDGVHFDEVPDEKVIQQIGEKALLGLTTNNNLATIKWAAENAFDYISFCSMFPSPTANSCDLVDFESVQKARSIFNGPIFLAGGIRPENLNQLQQLEFDGVAVVSGIMSAENPNAAIKNYQQKLRTL